ncbi:MAG: hypothetical protein WB992_24700 [Bryobacteraceae bacterium]
MAGPGKPLTTWAEIATHLDVSIRTAQTYEEKHGLPVHRLPGEKARVYAYSEELDSWKQHARGGAQHHSESAMDGQSKSAQPTIGTASQSSRRNWYWLCAAAILALSSGSLFFRSRDPLADFRVQGNSVIGVSQNGRELWRHVFQEPVIENGYQAPLRYQRNWLGIFPGERVPALLFTFIPVTHTESGDKLFCFDDRGKVRWSFTPGRTVYDLGGSVMVPPYFINSVKVAAAKQAANTRIVISSNHYKDQPDQVAMLNSVGHVVGEYWHPGHLLHMALADLDGNGKPVLLLGGVNNGYHQATLVVLDPLRVRGIISPRGLPDPRFELIGMQPAKEKAVIFFPRSCLSQQQSFTRVGDVRVTEQRIVVVVAEGTDEIGDPQLIYEMDYQLRLQDVSPTDSYVRRHRALEATGKLDHHLTMSEFEDLKKNRLVIVKGN